MLTEATGQRPKVRLHWLPQGHAECNDFPSAALRVHCPSQHELVREAQVFVFIGRAQAP